MLDHYVDVLRTLGRQPGILGAIYSGSQSRFNNPVNLKKLLGLIDETEWTSLGVDVKAAAFEGLLEKAASEGKKGAGQYFTPRLLIQAIVRCIKPDPRAHPEFTVCDPACGSGGFLMCCLRVADGADQGGRARSRDLQAGQGQDLLRPGSRRASAPTRADEPLPPRPRARRAPRRCDLRGP